MGRDNGPRVRVPEQRAPERAAVEEAGLYFSLLGPVRARRGEESLPSGSPQQRALLAALLLRGGRTATAAELIDAIWGEDPPSQALAAVRTYASRLRKTLGPLTLASDSGGYAMRIGPEALDLTVAQDRASDAEKARASGDRCRARTLLNEALGRQAEALAVYADTRRLLAEELGVDPRPELATLQQRILRADEELARPVDEPAPASAPVLPAQLPATVPDFTGRSSFVRELGDRLATAEGSVMAVSALAGIGGVGKT
ncbi:winged helix-turn-helix domain-containing protein, partial [Streptomyces sp. P01-B04]|uniref:AfsR/SARP family transcriptional regulator n=1 Tax=Streptomyces poriferorum TaxID=2798799 RepID=UPI001C5D363E